MPRGRPRKNPEAPAAKPAAAAKPSSPLAYTHDTDTRKGLPTGGTAGRAAVPKAPKKQYWYNPHLAPVLRHDETGKADRVLALVDKAGREPLSPEEKKILEEALRNHQPWLEWSGKREAEAKGYFEVDPVALSIHERVSPQAILRAARREDVQRELFADPQEPWTEAVKFYRHDVEWANRLILGDSLQVMTSLAEREGLAGKVQMIYIDPPYGIRFLSNFQASISNREVKESDDDLTREAEMIQAFRDTWTLGIHSYSSYLKNRITVAHSLLSEMGSIFVQISEENLHIVRIILDEVFGRENFVVIITIKKKSSTAPGQSVADYIIWYAKKKDSMKLHKICADSGEPEDSDKYRKILLESGERIPLSLVPDGIIKTRSQYILREDYPVDSQHPSNTRSIPIVVCGKTVSPPKNRQWSFDPDIEMKRLEKAERLRPAEKSAFGIVYWGDSESGSISNIWTEFHGEANMVYAVQTNNKIIERCVLMTSDPGDLVLDPTCGSGTTAYVAEKLGRRWIVIDTSRVAMAIARHRLMTERYENYVVKNAMGGVCENPKKGFIYKTVPQITLKGIAKNRNLDPIFEKHEPLLDAALKSCNVALAAVDAETKRKLEAKYANKQRAEGKRALTDADERRWKLKEKWEHWEVPFDIDTDWPARLQKAVTDYRAAWRAKMDEVNACIAANADQEELVDQPELAPGLRVSGPFTVEGVLPVEYTRAQAQAERELAAETGSAKGAMFTGSEAPAYGPDVDDEDYDEEEADSGRNAEAYFDQMLRLLKMDGVTFKGNKVKKFAKLSPLWSEGRDLPWQAEGWWEGEDESAPASVALLFGPQYGPLTAMALEEAMQKAPRASYTELVAAAFSFEPEASELVADEASHAKLRIHQAFIRPDINPGMEGLLKDQPRSQLFTVFGKPEIALKSGRDGDWQVELKGVDIYDPITGDVLSSGAAKVAAWFLDSDYDGRAFCITQAFFPDQDAWEKIRKALKTEAEDYAFDAYKGTVSVPFKAGSHARVAVKVIDPRGNEVMVVKKLEGK